MPDRASGSHRKGPVFTGAVRVAAPFAVGVDLGVG